MSTPAATSEAICCSVALTSDVLVVVIDWMLMGASPPTSTRPSRSVLDVRRSVSMAGVSIPRARAASAGGAAPSFAEHMEDHAPAHRLGLVQLQEHQSLPASEHGLTHRDRDRVRGLAQEHLAYVRAPVGTFVRLLEVLRPARQV